MAAARVRGVGMIVGDRARGGRLTMITVAMLVVVSSCNGDDASPTSTTPAGSADSTPTSQPSSPSTVSSVDTSPTTVSTPPTSVSSSSVPGETTPPTDPVPTSQPPTTVAGDFAEAIAVWQAAVTAAAGSGDVAAAASPAAVDAFTALERFLGEPLVFHTTASAGPDGLVAIEECLLTPASETGALLLRGEVAGDGGRVESLDFEDAFGGCVPADVNEAVLAAYAEYSDAFVEFASPPNPDDPRLDQMVSGSYRQFLHDLLVQLQDDGEEFRGDPPRDAYVVRYLAPDRLLIGDCQAIPMDFGTFIAGTDQRTDGYPQPEVGQTDYLETTMELIEGRWMVSSVAEEISSPCEDLATSRAVTVVVPVP